MGRNESTEAIDLDRVACALAEMGKDYLTGPDRLVVSFPAMTATVWIDTSAPRTLLVDSELRIPVDFSTAGDIAFYINKWNHQSLGGTASYRLEDSGDYAVRMRSATRIRRGLSPTQLAGELEHAFDHALCFTEQVSNLFHDVSSASPLPPALIRRLDHLVLHDRHPRNRHLPAGIDLESRPDDQRVTSGSLTEDVHFADLTDALSQAGFVYEKYSADSAEDHDPVTLTVNGVPLMVCMDGNEYARIAAVWDKIESTPAALLLAVCNDVNEATLRTRSYSHGIQGTPHLYVETVCRLSDGLSAEQLVQFIVSGMLDVLSAVDDVSLSLWGTSAVNWPNP